MKKFLIVNPFAVGDVLFTTPVINAIKQTYPESFVAYLCNRSSRAVLEHNPGIDQMYHYTRGDLKQYRAVSFAHYVRELWKGVNLLRSMRFDRVIDLSLVNQYSVILWLAGIKDRWGFNYKGRGRLLNHHLPLAGFEGKHVIDYYADLMAAMGIGHFERRLFFFLSAEERQWARVFLERYQRKDRPRFVGISAGGGASWGNDAQQKRWPLARYAALIAQLRAEYNVQLILFGSPAEGEIGAYLEREAGTDALINAVGHTTLRQCAALIEQCRLLISNDSGPLHLACALDVPTIAVFGPVDERVYGPVGNDSAHQVVHADISCRPCYRNFKKPVCGRMECLDQVDESALIEAVRKVL